VRIRTFVLTVVVVLCAASAQAGSVTWQFVETTGGSGAGFIPRARSGNLERGRWQVLGSRVRPKRLPFRLVGEDSDE
jgi:hypothetical protein